MQFVEKVIKLSNGVIMPHIGLGTYPLYGDELRNIVFDAYELGYRLIDTADNYYNENDLGKALNLLYKQRGAKREDLFLVSKVSDELYPANSVGGGANRGIYFWKSSPEMQSERAVHNIIEKKISKTLNDLKTDYVDLYLMHWPYPDFLFEMWYEMEQLYKSGKVRAIGICNCRERHFESLKGNSSIMPMVNQFETSPLNTKEGLVNYCNSHNIKVMVYSPLMNLRWRDSRKKYQECLKSLSEKYQVSQAQICLRFDVQRGLIPIPKSSHKERLQSNIDVLSFELEDSEISELIGFNENLQTLPESKSCPGL